MLKHFKLGETHRKRRGCVGLSKQQNKKTEKKFSVLKGPANQDFSAKKIPTLDKTDSTNCSPHCLLT